MKVLLICAAFAALAMTSVLGQSTCNYDMVQQCGARIPKYEAADPMKRDDPDYWCNLVDSYWDCIENEAFCNQGADYELWSQSQQNFMDSGLGYCFDDAVAAGAAQNVATLFSSLFAAALGLLYAF